MSVELIAIATGIFIAWLLFTAIIKILKTSITTALAIGAILLIIQVAFGIRHQQILQEIQQLIQKFFIS